MVRVPAVFGLASVLLGQFCTSSCAAGDSRETYPALSQSRTGQASFRRLQRRFFDEDEPQRPLLRPALERFLHRYPGEPRAASVKIWLAWVLILEGRHAEAERLLTEVRTSAATPSVHDFAEVAAARLLIAQQNPEGAFAKLEPLAGKLVDPAERLIYSELRLRAALASRRFAQALSALSAYLAEAPADLDDRARGRAESAVKELPITALESSLSELDEKARVSALSAPETWLRRIVRDRLIRLAVDNKDHRLARRLLDAHPGLARRDELSQELMQLAARASTAARSEGSFVGLALEIGDPDVERRSASVARGLSEALSAAQPGVESMPLVVRAADAHGVGATLTELAQAGALAVVAGVSDISAEQAATWAVSGGVPVLLIRDTPDLVLSEFSFVLGSSDVDQVDAIQKELGRLGLSEWARVGSGGADCRATPDRAGAGRFPVKRWKADGVQALAVLGPRSCAMELFGELRALNYAPLVALGLEGAELFATAGRRNIALSSGHFPRLTSGADVTADFYQSLGHDAGVLVRAAWMKLSRAQPKSKSSANSARLSEALALATAPLETTDSAGFSGKRRLPRRLGIKLVP